MARRGTVLSNEGEFSAPGVDAVALREAIAAQLAQVDAVREQGGSLALTAQAFEQMHHLLVDALATVDRD
jgi:hypothetical protein